MKGRIITINHNARTYFEAGEAKLKSGENADAISFLYKAFTLGETRALYPIAKTYEALGEFDLSLKFYFMALNSDPSNIEICHAIANVFMTLDDEDTAFYYITDCMTKERFEYIMEETDRLEAERLRVRMLEGGDTLLFNVALKLIASGNTEYARETLFAVRKGSKEYPDACNLLSLSFLQSEDADSAIQYATLASENGGGVESTCNLIMAHHLKGNHEEAARLADLISQRKLTYREHSIAAKAFVEIDDAPKAIEHLRVVLDGNGANRDALVSFALAKYKLGMTAAAKSLLIKASKLHPYDITITEFLYAIARGESLSLTPLLGEKKSQDWLILLDGLLDELEQTGTPSVALDQAAGWVFQTGFITKQLKAVQILTQYKHFMPLMLEVLLDDTAGLSVKRAIVCSMMKNYHKHKFFKKGDEFGLVIDGLFERVKVVLPSGLNPMFTSAYCHAFASFSMTESAFEKHMASVTRAMAKRYDSGDFKQQITDEKALTAAIFKGTKHSKITTAKSICNLFGCTQKQLLLYLDLFNLRRKKRILDGEESND